MKVVKAHAVIIICPCQHFTALAWKICWGFGSLRKLNTPIRTSEAPNAWYGTAVAYCFLVGACPYHIWSKRWCFVYYKMDFNSIYWYKWTYEVPSACQVFLVAAVETCLRHYSGTQSKRASTFMLGDFRWQFLPTSVAVVSHWACPGRFLFWCSRRGPHHSVIFLCDCFKVRTHFSQYAASDYV